MKNIFRAAWISYFIFFLWTSLSSMVDLVSPDSRQCGYYLSLIAFHRPNAIWYAASLLAAFLSIVSLWPLFVRAFALPITLRNFFGGVLFVRIIADICGHNYELMFFKSICLNNPQATLSVAIIAVALYLPSYLALAEHAFKPPKRK